MTLVVWADLPEFGERRGFSGLLREGMCEVVGCDRPLYTDRLCQTHRYRQDKGQPLTRLSDLVGLARSGHGVLGVIIRTDEQILCYECGQWYRSLPTHLDRTHRLTSTEYRDRHELPSKAPLSCGDTCLRHSESIRRRMADPEYAAFIAERLAEGRARSHDRPQRRRAGSLGPQARLVPGRQPRQRPCTVCGSPIPVGAARSRKTCSDECRLLIARRGAARAGAVRTGEPYAFTRCPGEGEKVTRHNIEALTGIAWSVWDHRVGAGSAPPHDGRIDGEKFWWQSTVTAHQQAGYHRARGQRVYSPETAAKIRSLIARGWSGERLGKRLGIAPDTLRRAATADRFMSDRVAQIDALYAELADADPPMSTGRERRAMWGAIGYAVARGWTIT